MNNTTDEKKTVLEINVQPKSSKSMIKADETGAIKVYLNSPPADGKANAECIQLFSKKLKIAKSLITIDKGEKGRKKRLLIKGLTKEEIMKVITDE